jgi:hypothetical protein
VLALLRGALFTPHLTLVHEGRRNIRIRAAAGAEAVKERRPRRESL